MARAGMCPRLLGRLRPEAPVAGPEAGLEAAEAMETDRAPAKGSQDRGQTRAAEDPQGVDLPEATRAWVALDLLEVAQGVVQAMVAVDQGRLIQEVVVARILGITTTHQVEDLIRRVEAVVAADRIRPGDEY